MATLLRISPDVVSREIDNEAVLLDLASGMYFGLNEVATRVWQLLAQSTARHAIVETIAREYEVDRRVLEADLTRLFSELQSRRLVVAQDPSDSM